MMTLALPLWGWIGAAITFSVALLFSYGCGEGTGYCHGVDFMKREAIRNGAAKACDFDGGWRWFTRDELAARAALHTKEPG
ncbi:MAG TPA: hypothetical protein VHW02_07675 [Rhizomicrobium sp.]|jgi:hypothetical protein|nr:hypothetical protein [Rhizomicrobium sp.]